MQYRNSFELIFYGLAIAFALTEVGKMIANRNKVTAYWLHIIMLLAALLTLLEEYFGMQMIYNILEEKPEETGKWRFLFTRLLPISTLCLLLMQLFPTSYKGKVNFKQLIKLREERILILVLLFLICIILRNWLVIYWDCGLFKLLSSGHFNFLITIQMSFSGLVLTVLLFRKLRVMIPIIYCMMLMYIVILMTDPYQPPCC